MAPWGTISATPSSAPLADYFFISGIESHHIFDARKRHSTGFPNSPSLDTTAEESFQSSHENIRPASPNGISSSPPHSSKRASARLSYDNRKSVGSIIGLETKVTASNRSSATIRPIPAADGTHTGLSEADFEDALKKFAQERDSILEEISFNGRLSSQPNRSAPKLRERPRTVRISSGEAPEKGLGSVRRRLSTMNPLSRSGTPSRRSSARVSRNMSNYNSVIPNPQRFVRNDNMHPLKRPYEPTLLDQYPSRDAPDQSGRRCKFPDYVPMFVFPNDINVVSSDDRPKSTWHSFTMTGGDGTRLQGVCVTIWVPVEVDAADELERQCDIWRKKNMSTEERELAKSLGERLARERSNLGDLLTDLREGQYDDDDREALEEKISDVEEKIGLMTDMLKPVRQGAASRIEGLTDGDSGFWIPRAYGVLGRDTDMTSFWKEWLKAVVVPMTHGGILRVPPSSPRVGTWQPLERYVVNLCVEALSPITSATQVELGIRDLRLYARKDAINEIPGSRNVDLYPLFRALNVESIVILLEFVLAESRIIFVSSHTAMLHLATAAMIQLIYPLKWQHVFIPVLPSRLRETLDAPCPYIVGIERGGEPIDPPDDDFVMVDLDTGDVDTTHHPTSLPRQQRKKLEQLLKLAAPLHLQFGVPKGPPKYATETFPHSAFSTENPSVFDSRAPDSSLSKYAGLSSSNFGYSVAGPFKPPVFNAFSHGRPVMARRGSSNSTDRPSTSSTSHPITPPSPGSNSSPVSNYFQGSNGLPRNDSGLALQASLREKRSGLFDNALKRTSTFGFERMATGLRRPSVPLSAHSSNSGHSSSGHSSSVSVSTLHTRAPSQYAPSVYAQSTIAPSTMMPQMMHQPVRNTSTMSWQEGHCMIWQTLDKRGLCNLCEESCDDGVYQCRACGLQTHARCLEQICLVCPAAFHADQVQAAFVRCFASLFYTYRRYFSPATAEQRKTGVLYRFNMDGFMRSGPSDLQEYLGTLQQSQAFNEFIHERETTRADDPSIRLFDEVIMAKRNRGRPSMFSKVPASFLADHSDHLWRSAAATTSNQRLVGAADLIVGRSKDDLFYRKRDEIRANDRAAPARLDQGLIKEPRMMQGVPRVVNITRSRRKPVPSMLRMASDDVIDPSTADPSTAFAPSV